MITPQPINKILYLVW